MASKISDHSRSASLGAAAADRRSGVPVFPPNHARLAVGIGVVVLALTVFIFAGGMRPPPGDTRAASAATKGDAAGKEDADGKTVVKRPLPPDVTEDQVPKWVPHRQASGRTELEPWNSVDADTGRDDQFRVELMGPRKPKRSLPERRFDSLDDEASGPLEQLQEDEALDEEAVMSGEPDESGLVEEGPSTQPPEEEVNQEPFAAEAEPGSPAEATG